MTVYIWPQSTWELAVQEVNGPAPKGVPGTWVIHYPGSSSSYEPMTNTEMTQYLRNMQNSYLNGRGYSIGYSVVVSQSGSAWAGRGLEGYPRVRVMNPASNPGKKLGAGNQNHVTRSIQIAVGNQNEASPKAVETVNAIIATQPDWPVIWHGQIGYTKCAGEGIINQIKSGVIGHQEEGEQEMKMIEQYRATDTREWPGMPLSANEHHTFNTGNRIPMTARWIIATLTVTEPDASGYVSTAAPGKPLGEVSSLNYAAGQTVANTTYIPVREREYQIVSAGGSAHVVVDVLGFVI